MEVDRKRQESIEFWGEESLRRALSRLPLDPPLERPAFCEHCKSHHCICEED